MRVRICDLRTGRRILDLPYLKADWTGEFNGAETVTATVSTRAAGSARMVGRASTSSAARKPKAGFHALR